MRGSCYKHLSTWWGTSRYQSYWFMTVSQFSSRLCYEHYSKYILCNTIQQTAWKLVAFFKRSRGAFGLNHYLCYYPLFPFITISLMVVNRCGWQHETNFSKKVFWQRLFQCWNITKRAENNRRQNHSLGRISFSFCFFLIEPPPGKGILLHAVLRSRLLTLERLLIQYVYRVWKYNQNIYYYGCFVYQLINLKGHIQKEYKWMLILLDLI